MSLGHGRHYLAIPGPSVMPDRVLQAMHRPSPNIYDGPLIEMTDTILSDLKIVAGTKAHVAIYICNGHGTWEAALSNFCAPGDKVLTLATGHFGMSWGRSAARMGIENEALDFGFRDPVDLSRFEAALRADTGHRIKAVLATQVDTSSSVKTDMQALRGVLEATGHPALLMSDNIASCGVDEFRMDDWGIDVMVTASQKGLMVPAGLGFVFASDRAIAARRRLDRVSPYWDILPRIEPELFFHLFAGTAPTHHLYGLREALDMMLEEGLEQIWARHTTLARAIWAAIDAWGAGSDIRCNVADPADRAHGVTTLSLGVNRAHQLRGWVEDHMGLTLGIPLGADPAEAPSTLRIGHMGHVNAHMVLGTLGVMEAGMQALDIAHGAGGVSAAAGVMAQSSA